MTPARLRELLARVASGELDGEGALEELRELPFSDIGEALVDSHREIRTGIPEIVFGERKTTDQIVDIVDDAPPSRPERLRHATRRRRGSSGAPQEFPRASTTPPRA